MRPTLNVQADLSAAERTARVRRPLSSSTFLFRNLKKTLPLIGVILLAVMLVCGIVAMMNAIPYSIRTTYAYSQEFVAITPRGDPTLPPVIANRVAAEAPVKVSEVMFCRATGTQVRSIVGKWQFANLGLKEADVPFYLERMKVTSIDGRVPKKGQPEVLVSEPVARNLGLKIGSILQSPDNQDSYSPQEVKVVGIAQTKRWIMLGDYHYQAANHFPPVDGVLAFAENPKDQPALDRWAVEEFKGERAAVIAYYQVNEDTDLMFATLYRILNVVIGTLVLVITIMMGMLINIYQGQRLVEFGLLQALGYTKKRLVTRVLRETAWVVLVGWLMGLAASLSLLTIVDRTLMYPNAYSFQVIDAQALWYTVPVPIAIMAVAFFTVALRFRKFDPVGVVERRLV